MMISPVNLSNIDIQNVEELRRLFIQLMNNPSRKIIIDFKGIQHIESKSLLVIEHLVKLAESRNVRLEFIHIENKLSDLLNTVPLVLKYIKPSIILKTYRMNKAV
ncbi:MAG: STAS domain-containing protein [Bacteroidales bacterium]|nr:STAS domain-containing protein [Bacteroidales bacterium]MBN2821455.1 STAS domain-containing protein [Bacteroidales bacterium]